MLSFPRPLWKTGGAALQGESGECLLQVEVHRCKNLQMCAVNLNESVLALL